MTKNFACKGKIFSFKAQLQQLTTKLTELHIIKQKVQSIYPIFLR